MTYTPEFNRRTYSIYTNMRNRFADRLWKSGKKKGTLKTPGRPIPFTLEEFRSWAFARLTRYELAIADLPTCGYCKVELLLSNCGLDHVVPTSRGGGLGLDNLQLICQRCNFCKGSMSSEGYDAFYFWATRALSATDQKDLFDRLAMALQLAQKDRLNSVRFRALLGKMKGQEKGRPHGRA